MRLFLLSVLASAAMPLLGSPVTPHTSPWGEVLVKHKWISIPDSWVTLSHPADGAMIDLHIALKPDRENALVDALKEVSQPGHPKYGAHLTKEQVAQLVAPHPDTLKLVSSWLQYNGIPPSSISQTHGGGWLTVAGVPVSKADKLLGASYRLYHHPGTNETILRTATYALPAALHGHVRTIAPTTAFTSTRLLRSEEAPCNRSCGAAEQAVNVTSEEPGNILSRAPQEDRDVEPPFLRLLYQTQTYSPTSIDKNALGIVGFQNEVPNLSDLRMFMVKYREDEADLTPDIKKVVDHSPGLQGMQANLDSQYALALASPTPVIYYSGTGNGVRMLRDGKVDPGDQYLQWLNYMTEQRNIPQTISFGYSTDEPSISKEYADALCLLFAKIGARGTSVFVASGDVGVGKGTCKTVFGDVQFYTGFPASCPWVTSVGGTKLISPYVMAEVAIDFSGGGFSAYFDRHEYQIPAITDYLDVVPKAYAGYFDPMGRGVPDIALQSSTYVMVYGAKGEQPDFTHTASGTSCATNTAAAIFSLLNDYRISEGKPPRGWLNPWLYKAAQTGSQGLSAFNDITLGTNPGCETLGFSAVPGWDPVTGLGSPVFPVLQLVIDDEPNPEELPPAFPAPHTSN